MGGAVRQIAVTLNSTEGGLTHRLATRAVAQQLVCPSRQFRHVLHDCETTGVSQHCDMVGEVAGVWSDRNCTAEARWLERILSASWRQQTSADEGKRGQAIQQPELAQRIGDPYPLRRRYVATRTIAIGPDAGAPFGMAWSDYG